MPRTRSLAWSELKIGVLGIIALALTAALVFSVGGQAGLFSWQRIKLKTTFDDVRGLKEGAVVRLAGVEVGKVSEVSFGAKGVDVMLEVNDDMQSRIMTDSTASIGSLSLLGEPIIELTPGRSGTPIPDGGFINPGRSPSAVSDVAASANRGLEEATRLIQSVREGKGTIGKLFTDEQLYREVNAFVTAAENVATHISRGRGTLGRLVQDPAAAKSLEASLANLDAITRQINAGEGSLGRLLKDDAIAKSASSAFSNIDTLTGQLNKGQGTAGKLFTEEELYNRLNSLAGRIDSLTKALNEGDGTAGRLLRDKQLYENMNAATNELRGLISDIRKDPKKYLNVRVSIF
jgi:phospholipid/cholesterol/gamma-HCH transport system substrate-binding protein